MKITQRVLLLCLVLSVTAVSLTNKRKTSAPQKWLVVAVANFRKDLQKPLSIEQIRLKYKSVEIACFVLKSPNFQINLAKKLQKGIVLEGSDLKTFIDDLRTLESALKNTTNDDWSAACLASLRNNYLITMAGANTETAFEQKNKETLAEIKTLIELNQLSNLPNKTFIAVRLSDYLDQLSRTNYHSIDYKSIYTDFVLPLESAYLENISGENKKTLFEENFLTNERFSSTKPDSTKIALGKLLFYDTALSQNFKRSCSSCHRPQKAFCDNRQTSLGFRLGTNLTKNAPSLINAIHNTAFFHDGRAKDISAVIEAVVTSPDEFNTDFSTIAKRLSSSEVYKQKFGEVYQQSGINQAQIQEAVVVFIASLSSNKSKFDHWIGTKNHQSDFSVGYNIYTKNCASCHFTGTFSGFLPPLFTQNIYQNSIKIPTLRNIARTQPYMHDGSTVELSEVIKKHHGSQLSETEHQSLKHFLEALTDTNIDKTEPKQLPVMPAAPHRKVGGYY